MGRTLRLFLAAACLILLAAGCGQPEPSAPAAPAKGSASPVAHADGAAPADQPSGDSAAGLSHADDGEAVPTLPAARPTPTPAPLPPADQAGLSPEQVLALSSLELVDDYPLYTMRYVGPYEPLPAAGRLGPALEGRPTAWACALFAALGEPEAMLYGRNFDWEMSPALLLFTDPPDGYASASLVDIAYLGFTGAAAKAVAELPLEGRRALLLAPNLPFDGMNEHGLAVGMAAVPAGNVQPDPAKETIGSLGVIREMLDHARTVDEAVAILRAYNVDMEGEPPLHYLIADRSGRAALVEFSQGEVVVLPNEGPWHLATNFLRAEAGPSPAGRCWRYDALSERLEQAQGRLTPAGAMDLLAAVAQAHTQWSVVYGISSGSIEVSMGQQFGSVHRFSLDK